MSETQPAVTQPTSSVSQGAPSSTLPQIPGLIISPLPTLPVNQHGTTGQQPPANVTLPPSVQQQTTGVQLAPGPQAPPAPLLTLPPVVQQPDLQGGGDAPQGQGQSQQQLPYVWAKANNALQAAAMAQHQASYALKGCENLAKAQARTVRWTRDLKISQVKGEFKSPQDKKVN